MCNLHWCYTFWTGVTLEPALLSANQNRVIFFMCIINHRYAFHLQQEQWWRFRGIG